MPVSRQARDCRFRYEYVIVRYIVLSYRLYKNSIIFTIQLDLQNFNRALVVSELT